MEILWAELKHLDEIIAVNKIDDYGNPDEFINESIEKQRVLVWTQDDRVIGFLLFQYIWGNAPLMHLIKIHTDYQKLGGGTKLIEVFEKHLKEEGYKDYYSSTGQENTGAQIFHTKKGFIKIGILNMSFGEEVFYKKEL